MHSFSRQLHFHFSVISLRVNYDNMTAFLKIGCLFLIFLQNANSQRIRFPGGRRGRPIRGCQADTTCLPQWECTEFSNQRLSFCRSPQTGRRQVCCPRATETVEEPRNDVESSVEGFQISEDCGLTRTAKMHSMFVMGGEDSEQGAWPWMVAITRRNSQGVQEPWCSGFLIDRRHVLTAAHCFNTRSRANMFSTKIGDVDLREGRTFNVQRLVLHPGYRGGMFYDDIAMLTLERPVDIETVNPICLPTPEIIAKSMDEIGTAVAGWGAERFGGEMSYTLKELNGIPTIPNDQCNKALETKLTTFRRQFPRGINEGFICAGFLEGEKDSCGGDSGAPLMLLDAGRWYAVGIVSFGYGCGNPGFPGGYTRVSHYLDWIRREARN